MKTLMAVAVILSGLLLPSVAMSGDVSQNPPFSADSVYETQLAHQGYRYHRHYKYGLHYRGDRYRYRPYTRHLRPYRNTICYYRHTGGIYCR